MTEENRRLSVNLPDTLAERFDKFPWGVRSELVRVLVEWACDMFDQHGQIALGAILERDFKLEMRSRYVRSPDTPAGA